MPRGFGGMLSAGGFDLRWGTAGVSGNTDADAGDSGTRETSFFVHRWRVDPAAIAHDPALHEFFLECEVGWHRECARWARTEARRIRRSSGWREGRQERGIFRGGDHHNLC